MNRGGTDEPSEVIRQRVTLARSRQASRYQEDGLHNNAQLKPRHIRKYCKINEESKKLLEQAVTTFGLSARAYGRILRVARTIADLADSCHD